MAKQTSLKNFMWLWLALLVFIADQYSKHLVLTHMTVGQPTPILPFFNLNLSFNTGAAFSLLRDAGGWQQWLFGGVAVIVSAIILLWLYRLPKKEIWAAIALSFVLGGAIGNLYDRITLGYVIDFLQLYYHQWSWPIFNIADASICIGAVMLFIDIWRS